MELSSAKDAFDQAAKKQKLSSSKLQEVVDQVGREIEQALATIQSDRDTFTPSNHVAILADLKTKLNALRLHNHTEESEKELYVNLSRYNKLLEKILISDISKAYRNVDFDHHILNEIIAHHFYVEGQFDMADSLVYEASEPEDTTLRLQFVVMHRILEALKSRNLQPALNWALANREKLKDAGSNLELKLHGLQFVEILKSKCQTDAINYARTYLAPLAPLHMDEVQKLMGCLLYIGKLDRSPYSDLMDPTQWEKLAEQLHQQFCSLLGRSHQSPLRVAIAAGVEGLPPLIKLANVMAVKKQEWHAMKQLPVPLELGKEFHFHSVFVCPVTREQGSEENPPMLLPCGHVLCKQSIYKLSKSNTRTFKCPYCPFNASAVHCRQLYF